MTVLSLDRDEISDFRGRFGGQIQHKYRPNGSARLIKPFVILYVTPGGDRNALREFRRK
jgi:hypothetical protein